MTRLQELASTFADYTVGSIIVMAYMTTAQWRHAEVHRVHRLRVRSRRRPDAAGRWEMPPRGVGV